MNSKCGVQSKRKCESHESCPCIAGFSACAGVSEEERSLCGKHHKTGQEQRAALVYNITPWFPVFVGVFVVVVI